MADAYQRKKIADEYFNVFLQLERLEETSPKGLLLAHYTSVEVVEKILKNKEIWMSHPFHMNDIQELNFGMGLGVRMFRDYCYCSELPSYVSDEIFSSFQGFIRHLNENTIIDTYVVCFMAHSVDDKDGSLPMWRGYGDEGHGATIVFDPAPFQQDPIPNLRTVKVIYESEAGREKILSDMLSHWQKTTIENFAGVARVNVDSSDLFLASFYALLIIKMFALMTKHPGFRYEDEWRVVYIPEFDGQQLFSDFLSYNIGARGIEPKLKFNIEKYNLQIDSGAIVSAKIDFNKIIDSIILGPSISSPLAKASFLRALKGSDFDYLSNKVHSSTIPLRPSK